MSQGLGRQVLEIEAQALREVARRLGEDPAFDEAVRALSACRGRVIVTGMGKSGIVCRKIAATLASTGTPAFFLHPAEAVHGDLGVITEGDLVLAASNSGETPEILRVLEWLRRLGNPLIAMVGSRDSTLAREADIVLDVSVSQEACPLGLAPTASTTATLAVGDALAMALLETKGFTEEDFAARHPGGNLGRKILRLENVMHQQENLPEVPEAASMEEAVAEMSAKGLGLTALVDEKGRLKGLLTDGDLRRALQRARREGWDVMSEPASRFATAEPRTARRDLLAVEAQRLMEQSRITALPVVDEEGRLEGVVHIHDLWRTQLF